MKNNLLIICFISTGIFITGCPKPCIEANYQFNAHARFAPDTETINLGDTLYLESVFSTQLTDERMGGTIDYSGSTGIGSCVRMIELIPGDTTSHDAAN